MARQQTLPETNYGASKARAFAVGDREIIMDLHDAILDFLHKVQCNSRIFPDIAKLQGEVVQIKITEGDEYNFAFRDATVTLSDGAIATIKVEAEEQIIREIIAGRLDPFEALFTRRLRTKFDPIRGPVLRRILLGGVD